MVFKIWQDFLRFKNYRDSAWLLRLQKFLQCQNLGDFQAFANNFLRSFVLFGEISRIFKDFADFLETPDISAVMTRNFQILRLLGFSESS